jgi:hypothetical protein
MMKPKMNKINKKKLKGNYSRISLWNRIPIVKVWKDISNYKSWIRTIDEEIDNPKSKFNKYKMDRSYFYVLYLPVSLPEEDALLPDNIKRLRLMEILSPVHQYLDDDLGFAGYLIPEFSQFYDEDNNPTLTYAAIYRFAFNKLSFKWFFSRLFFWISLIWVFRHFHIISWLISHIK